MLTAAEDHALGRLVLEKFFGFNELSPHEQGLLSAELGRHGGLYTADMVESVRKVLHRAATLRARETIHSGAWVNEHYTGRRGCVKALCQQFLVPPLEIVRAVLPQLYHPLTTRLAVGLVENMVREHAREPCTGEFPPEFMARVHASYVERLRGRGSGSGALRAVRGLRFREADCYEFVWALLNDYQGQSLPSARKEVDVEFERGLADWFESRGVGGLVREEDLLQRWRASGRERCATPDLVFRDSEDPSTRAVELTVERGGAGGGGGGGGGGGPSSRGGVHRLHWVDVKNMYFTSCGGDWRSEQMLGVAKKYADVWGPGGIVFTNGFAEPIADNLREFGVCALDGSAVFAEQGRGGGLDRVELMEGNSLG